jgi:hypothetical protein
LREDVPARNLLREDRGEWTGHSDDARWVLDGEFPAGAAGLVRSDWLSHPPHDLTFMAGTRLTAALRVARFLERHSATVAAM